MAAFQRDHGLTVDGAAGQETQSLLFSSAVDPQPEQTPAPSPAAQTASPLTPQPTPSPTPAPTPDPVLYPPLADSVG